MSSSESDVADSTNGVISYLHAGEAAALSPGTAPQWELDMPVTESDVFNYVGQRMGDICNNHYDTPAENHCAHFVSHALGISTGLLCGSLTANVAARNTGATVRCNELFNNLPVRGAWASRPLNRMPLLVFVTFTQNVAGNLMGMMPSKHVGIVFAQNVYNFSNTNHIVRFDESPEKFFNRMSDTYKRAHPRNGDLGLYYAAPPISN
jgi:hypothetical protein